MTSSTQRTTTGCWDGFARCICSCGGRRVPQVTPGDPIPTITPGSHHQSSSDVNPPIIDSEPLKISSGRNGHTNHFFVPDENEQVSYATDEIDGHPPSSSKGENIAQEVLDFHLKHSVFIEIAKDRKLRVVHLKEINPEEPKPYTSPSSAASTSSSPNDNNPDPSSEPNSKDQEEDEEYWFSKWTRKPRFRSIFERNTIHSGSTDEQDDPSNPSARTNENNNTVEGGDESGGGQISKEFELARAAAAAKRRAWAYNNGSCDPVVEQSTEVEEEDEEFNSICMFGSMGDRKNEGLLKNDNDNKEVVVEATAEDGSSNGCQSPNDRSPIKVESVKVEVQNHPLKSPPQQGFMNLGFEQDEDEDETIMKSCETVERSEQSSNNDSKENNSNAALYPGEESLTVLSQFSSPNYNNNNSNIDPNNALMMTEVDLSTPKQPALFFIHGISGSSDVWKSQMDFFHNLGYEIVAPDLLGHGYSSTPYNAKYYYFESLAQDLLTVFDHFFQEGRKVVLIGHGYGACLAAVIVRVRPKCACLLISISGGGPTPLVSRACCRSSLIPFYCTMFHKNPRKGRFDNPELKHILPPPVHQFMLSGQVWSDGDSAFYRRIIVPTLLVYGMKDKVVNLVEECEMERTIPKSFLEIIDSAGHMVMFEEPHRLNKMLGKFVQSWS